MNASMVELAYVAAAVLFIFGLKGLSHPRTAVRGNLLGAIGMFVAAIATVAHPDAAGVSLPVIIAGVVVGSAIGVVLAIKVEMTSMPELVALFNGLGGGASVLVAGAALATMPEESGTVAVGAATVASGVIGTVTFWGSLVAFGKLNGSIDDKLGRKLPARTLLNGVIGLVCLALGVWGTLTVPAAAPYWILCFVATFLGVVLVLPIGGADMPVVIAFLNSLSGLAAAATGFVLYNNSLIVSGSLVGASGLILTGIMCKAMNRSLGDVLFGAIQASEGPSADDVYAGKIKSTSADEVAMLFDGAQRVVFVPGYGMAVSQAQHSVKELTGLLEELDIEVEFAIHPVAGRMPGHMNVLLAEAEISYDKLREMDDINPTFAQTDVAIVIGANDVVNPVARDDPKSPIAGMPILNVDQARTVVVIKRSLSPGFAGIPNPLFALDNTLMLFADGKQAVRDMIEAVKEMK